MCVSLLQCDERQLELQLYTVLLSSSAFFYMQYSLCACNAHSQEHRWSAAYSVCMFLLLLWGNMIGLCNAACVSRIIFCRPVSVPALQRVSRNSVCHLRVPLHQICNGMKEWTRSSSSNIMNAMTVLQIAQWMDCMCAKPMPMNK